MLDGWLGGILETEGLGDLTPEELADMLDDEQMAAILELAEREKHAEKFERFKHFFPDETITVGDTVYHGRAGYGKHLELFRLGATLRERLFMAGNRVGKTIAGAYETTCHLTGLYPDWWEGKRFRTPIRAYAAGKTNETTRDIVQKELLGEVTFDGPRKTVDGSGMIPLDKIGRGAGQLTWKQGVADLVDTVKIRHVSGGWSKLGLKSYQQGRGSFEGTAQHLIWFDEEPPFDVYGEAVIRTATTSGITLITFTPLEGYTETVLSFMPDDLRPAA